jgi:hypothetical protein
MELRQASQAPMVTGDVLPREALAVGRGEDLLAGDLVGWLAETPEEELEHS